MDSWIDITCTNCQDTTRVDRETVLEHRGDSFACQSCGHSVPYPILENDPSETTDQEPESSELSASEATSESNLSEAAPSPSLDPSGLPEDLDMPVASLAGSSDPDSVAPASDNEPAVADMPQPAAQSHSAHDELVWQKAEEKRLRRKTLTFIFVPVIALTIMMMVGGGFLVLAYAMFFSGGSSQRARDSAMRGGLISKNVSDTSKTGALVLELPDTRIGMEVFVDEERFQVVSFGVMRVTLAEGNHELVIKVHDQEVETRTFDLKSGEQYVYKATRDTTRKIAELSGKPDTSSGPASSVGLGVFRGWTQSLVDAKKEASDSDKYILIYFDGSDWCPYCQQITRNIFATQQFVNLADDKLVLVHVDFPHSDAAKRQVEDADRNAELAGYFRVFSYPTVLLTDADGQPIAEIDEQDAPALFASAVNRAIDFSKFKDRHISAVESALRDGKMPPDEILDQAVPAGYRSFYPTLATRWYDIASKSDPDNAHGVREEMFMFWWQTNQRRPDMELGDRLQSMNKRLQEFTEKCEFTEPEQAAAMFLVLSIMMRQVDISEAQRIAQQGIEYAPKDSRLKETLNRLSQGLLSGGSGVLVSEDGYILSNQHVVGYAQEVTVTLGDKVDQELTARVIATDVPNDLALLKLNDMTDVELAPLPLMETEVEKGADIFVCGFPGFEKYMVITNGIVSLPARQQPDKMILLDSTVNPGNSGGPLIASTGQVAGLLVMKTITSEDTDSMGLAIPVNRMIDFLKSSLSPEEFAKITIGPMASAKPDSLNQSVEPGTVRVLVKQVPLSQDDAEQLNEEVWDIVKRPDASAEEYAECLVKARQFCLAFPNGSYINSLGVAFYRNGMYHEAIDALEESSSLNEDDMGSPHPADLAFLAMAKFQIGEQSSARSLYRQLSNMMRQNAFEEDEDCQSFFAETQKVLGIDAP